MLPQDLVQLCERGIVSTLLAIQTRQADPSLQCIVRFELKGGGVCGAGIAGAPQIERQVPEQLPRPGLAGSRIGGSAIGGQRFLELPLRCEHVSAGDLRLTRFHTCAKEKKAKRSNGANPKMHRGLSTMPPADC